MKDRKSPLKILLAEDNAINQELVEVYLKMIGFSCDIANNGKIALEMIQSTHYDVILLDIHMPVMDGEEVLQTIRGNKKFDDLYIIALTAGVLHGDEKRYLEMGFSDFIAKPVRRSEIEEKLKKIMDHREASRL